VGFKAGGEAARLKPRSTSFPLPPPNGERERGGWGDGGIVTHFQRFPTTRMRGICPGIASCVAGVCRPSKSAHRSGRCRIASAFAGRRGAPGRRPAGEWRAPTARCRGCSGRGRGGGARSQRLHYLPDLFLHPLRCDQQCLQAPPGRQRAVAGQENAAFRTGAAGQFQVVGVLLVGRVVPQEPQPARQPSQHPVGEKAERVVCTGHRSEISPDAKASGATAKPVPGLGYIIAQLAAKVKSRQGLT